MPWCAPRLTERRSFHCRFSFGRLVPAYDMFPNVTIQRDIRYQARDKSMAESDVNLSNHYHSVRPS